MKREPLTTFSISLDSETYKRLVDYTWSEIGTKDAHYVQNVAGSFIRLGLSVIEARNLWVKELS